MLRHLGTTHGVYVLPDLGSESDTTLTSCLEVLQKPSCQIMKERGAVRGICIQPLLQLLPDIA